MPDEKLKKEAFNVYSQNNPSYSLACDLLEEAIAYNPNLNGKYEGYVCLWSLLSDLSENKNINEAVDYLNELMEDYPYIKKMYEPVINTLKTCDVDKIVNESVKLIKKYRWDDSKKVEVARLMEFAILTDNVIKDKYSVKLSLWKRGLSM